MWLACVSFYIDVKSNRWKGTGVEEVGPERKRTVGGGMVASWGIERGEGVNGRRSGPTYWRIDECDAASGREMDKVTWQLWGATLGCASEHDADSVGAPTETHACAALCSKRGRCRVVGRATVTVKYVGPWKGI